jgi:hypothetical protein
MVECRRRESCRRPSRRIQPCTTATPVTSPFSCSKSAEPPAAPPATTSIGRSLSARSSWSLARPGPARRRSSPSCSAGWPDGAPSSTSTVSSTHLPGPPRTARSTGRRSSIPGCTSPTASPRTGCRPCCSHRSSRESRQPPWPRLGRRHSLPGPRLPRRRTSAAHGGQAPLAGPGHRRADRVRPVAARKSLAGRRHHHAIAVRRRGHGSRLGAGSDSRLARHWCYSLLSCRQSLPSSLSCSLRRAWA